MARFKVFLSALLAGVCIAIGGTAYLSIDNKVVGALFFTVGLFTICIFGLHLFTGKVCYVFQNDAGYAFDLILIWLGNLAGTYLAARLERWTRIGPALAEKAAGLCQVKLSDGLLSIFILAIFCNIMIYIAVEGFNRAPHEMGRYIALFLGVAVFILCGFEHCVANMYYFSIAGAWSGKAFGYLLVMTAGNAVGGVIFPVCRQFLSKKKEGAKV